MRKDPIRIAVLCAMYGSALGGGCAWADAPYADPGTHLPGVATPLPTHVIERERIERSGLVSLGDLLQQLPLSGAALNTKYNQGGDGSTLVNLRHLEPKRTLVLVDGRRFIQNLAGATGLDAIPLAAVERIEILPGGASALYGADAVAGVVNVILRQRFDGAETRSQLGEYGAGDGRIEAYDFTIGDSSARASVLLNASYLKQEPVFAGAREISAVPVFGFAANNANAGASSTTPFGRFGFSFNGGRLPNGAPGTLTLIPGRSGASAADFRPFDPAADGYNFAPDNYLDTPQERTAVFARARYALSDGVELGASMLHNERRSMQQLAGFPLTFGVIGSGRARFMIPASALYNPFGREVTRAQFRPPIQPRQFRQDVDTFRFTSEMSGSFEAWERPWSWSLGYGYTDAEEHAVAIGQFDLERLRTGLGPSFRDAAGVARCGTPAAPIAGCVPIDIFSGPEGFTREMLEYATFVAQDTIHREQHGSHATLTGELFELPAGPLELAAGYEYRRESGFDQPDAFVSSGASTGTQRAPTRGGFSADDVFVELAVPLLQDVPLIESFAIDVAARHSDYSTFGATTNVAYGFRWRPFDRWQVRGAYAESFRAPSITELFLDLTRDFGASWVDPCARSRPPSGVVLQRCRRGFGPFAGLPDWFDQSGAPQAGTTGGNPRLGEEHGASRSLELSYRPGPSGTAFLLSWNRIEVTDLVERRSAQATIEDCYVRGRLAACELFTRHATGDIVDVFTGFRNVPGGLETEFFDARLSYPFAFLASAFRAEAAITYTTYFGDFGRPALGEIDSDGSRSRGTLVGNSYDRGAQYHRIKSNLTLDGQRGDFGATLGVRYLSAIDEDCSIAVASRRPELCSNPGGSPQFPRGENRLGATTYVDLQARWDTRWQGRLSLGLRNAFDEQPPVSFSTFANSFHPSYDLPGRFWYVAYSQRF